MPAYFVIELDIQDPAGFDEYASAVFRLLPKYGARYLVRRQPVEVLEGEWKPKHITLVEFPSKARAKEFYVSREFRDIMEIRRRSARTNLVLVEQPE